MSQVEQLGTIQLETERLILRRFTLSDAEAIYKNWTSDDAVTQYLTWQTHQSIADSKAFIEAVSAGYDDKTSYNWAICLKSNPDAPIGSIGLGRFNEALHSVEVGYALGKAWWRQGIMSEAFAAVISFAFKELKINRLVATHHLGNPNSGKVMGKCGLQYEGVLRQAGLDNQKRFVDLKQYSILATDFTI